MSQHRIQAYMDKHKLTPLFEELMNRVLRDLPEDPMVYLIKCLCKKASLEVPAELRRGGVRKSTSDLPRNRSPERSMKAALSSSADVSGSREYDRPWVTQAKRTKPRRSEEPDLSKSSPRSPHHHHHHSGRDVPSATARLESWDIDEFLQVYSITPSPRQSPRTSPREGYGSSPHSSPRGLPPLSPQPPPPRGSAGSKSQAKRAGARPEWNNDNRVKTTSFDDLWEEHLGRRDEPPQKSETIVDARKAWANVGLGDQGEEVYSSSGYTGPRRQTDLSDPIASEVPQTSFTRSAEESAPAPVVASHVRGRQIDALKHRQELGKILTAANTTSEDSGFVEEEGVEDEGIELLEDAEELRREGVSNVPASGYKLSRVIRTTMVLMKAFRHRDTGPNIKLNINLFPQPLSEPLVSDGRFAEGMPDTDQDDLERPPTGMSGRMSALDTDEEFESVSQVTGPRRPAWPLPDSDDSYGGPRPSYGQRPHRSGSRQGKGSSRTLQSKKMAASLPVRFGKPPAGRQSAESAQDFLSKSAKTWAQPPSSGDEDDSPPPPPVDVHSSLQSDHSGWNVPYDSDVASVHDWDQRVKGVNRDPRAY